MSTPASPQEIATPPPQEAAATPAPREPTTPAAATQSEAPLATQILEVDANIDVCRPQHAWLTALFSPFTALSLALSGNFGWNSRRIMMMLIRPLDWYFSPYTSHCLKESKTNELVCRTHSAPLPRSLLPYSSSGKRMEGRIIIMANAVIAPQNSESFLLLPCLLTLFIQRIICQMMRYVLWNLHYSCFVLMTDCTDWTRSTGCI